MSVRRLTVAALTALCLIALSPAAALGDHQQSSVFQDDAYLVYNSTGTVNRTLDTLRSLGVQTVRVNLKWSAVAPDATAPRRPPGFDASDPGAYPAAGWYPFDRLVELAGSHGITVEFNLTAPGPLWAMAGGAPTTRAADHWDPSAFDFFLFVRAVGRRYSGTYGQLPRVHVWSIWNEPNQPGWLAPQSRPAAGRLVPVAPELYRAYVSAAFAGLGFTGHTVAGDTILIGELAPEGSSSPGVYSSMKPLPFLRALYCVDASYRRLRGSAAAVLGCPVGGSTLSFVRANLGLFLASGFAHHPYNFFHSPSARSSDPDVAPLADLDRLESVLDRMFRVYRVPMRLPVYLTEYGYQTNPPDPYEVVSPAQQAAYLNQADYLAWRDPRVRSVAQFLLYDSPPDPAYAPSDVKYWDTFQTGLRFSSGRAKPALAAYQMPIWLPASRVGRHATLFVWGQLRPASSGIRERAAIQWRSPHGRFRTLATVTTTRAGGYLTARVRPPGSGELRILWRASSSRQLTSRSVAVTVA